MMRMYFRISKQVFDKISGSKSSDKLKSLIGEADASPEVQDKLKIAFAEGYMAKDKKEVSSSWSRRILKFAWYGLVFWLVLQILQMYTTIGGSEH